MQKPEIPDISVIIPTFNRSSALRWSLEHLETQTFRRFEVIVVDDGSGDDTAETVASYKAVSGLSITYARQENAGPAKARNRAVQLARAPLCIFIGDDILCTPEFLAIHFELHQRSPQELVCGLGLTRWESARQVLTPFMKAFEHIQFAYHDLLSGTLPDWRYFYTSNLSIKKSLLERYTFDEAFRAAAMEDMELGYRISRSEALQIEFLPTALALHYHPTTLEQAYRRSIVIGRSIGVFEQRWPEANLLPEPKFFRKIAHKILAVKEIRLALKNVLAGVSKFHCSVVLTRALLNSCIRVSYREYVIESGAELRSASTISQRGQEASE